VVRKERLPRTTALLDFLRSPEVNVLIRSHGYLPARQESAP
jgi:hypothetical protein